ncbi:SpoIIE family protein phosphatase [Streptomyces sp. SL13]|uniref:protein-serine/threonine phosphatase n=1 Tax=Streptantibioticus silvisoli TaxID=2705255 RepID=A0AA90K8Y5_9ACTN|nr:SpoIIE family protein phosphatase [Streptantibioticus silvisoli]MDI5967525.1 SpoIIE family protein phosphatase [Streptantibioticus silvisoli]MDI5970483.1 SpoIIE family protein phosphatase [Streptantibioticus silvisoli]
MSTGSDASRPGPSPPAGLLDTLRVGVIMLDTRGRIELWSQLAEEILGWPGNQVIGRPVDLVLATADQHPRLVLSSILRALERDGRWVGILPLRRRDGSTVVAEVRASMLTDGGPRSHALISLADTQLLRGVEHDLAVLDAVFDTSSAGIAIYDTDLRFVRVNAVLAAMNNRTPADHLGRSVQDVISGDTGRELAGVQRQVLETGRIVVDLLTPGADGVGFWSASYSRITDRRGQVLGISCVVLDVTDRLMAAVKVERARNRLAVLGDVGGVLSELMDIDHRAKSLAKALVPGFCDYAGLLVVEHVAGGGELPEQPLAPYTPLVLAGVATAPDETAMGQLLHTGMPMNFPAGSPFSDALAGGPAWFAESPADIRGDPLEPLDPRISTALELGVGSVLAVPLRARGVVLGLLVLGRSATREPFDADDLALGHELADRAGAALDNARLYAREREGTLMLQRALLPQSVPRLTGVEVAHRYVPGSSGAEAGGDWFDVVPLAGGRVAFVIGDVMGHGLSAAATMGRLRTAVRTLAGLDMAPDELLRRVNDLSDDFALSPEEPMMATCAYAVYDPSSRVCVIAKAGHLPPLLILPGRSGPQSVRRLDMPSNTPIGIGGDAFESLEFLVPEGAVLALYTDGLIERRGEDITEGIDRLAEILRRPYGSLEDVCDAVLAGMTPDREPDDVAVLMARLGGLPEGSAATWTFPAEATAVREARARVRETLASWELWPLTEVTVLLVSELVTNSLRHAHGPIGVRMVRGPSLLVEVSDPLADPPRARIAAETDEGGRGMHLVARAARRWGTRVGPFGKTVWFELTLPAGRPE